MIPDRKRPFFENPSSLVIVALCVLTAWIAWPWVVTHWANYSGEASATTGQFGDMYGGLNTLFSGLAFAGLVYTIFVQRGEMRETQQQVEADRKLAQAQRFQSAFFQLVHVFNEIIESMVGRKGRYSSGNGGTIVYDQLTGRDWMEQQAERLISMISEIPSESERNAAVTAKYLEFYTERQTKLGHYFRMLYRVLRWIERAPADERVFYVKTLRAQLSAQELTIIFFNCLSEYGENMKALVEKYALLKHLPDRNEITRHDRDRFSLSAFTDPN